MQQKLGSAGAGSTAALGKGMQRSWVQEGSREQAWCMHSTVHVQHGAGCSTVHAIHGALLLQVEQHSAVHRRQPSSGQSVCNENINS